MRDSRNCDGEHPSEVLSFAWMPDLDRCPHSVIGPQAMAYLDLWREWRELEVLPDAGGPGDQVAATYQALSICEGALARAESKRAQKQEATLEQLKAAAAAKGRDHGR